MQTSVQRIKFSFRVFVSVSLIELLVGNLNGYFSHRDNNLRQELGVILYFLMGSQHWGKEQQGKEDMRQLKLLQTFMGAQMNSHPVTMGCLTLCRRDANWIL